MIRSLAFLAVVWVAVASLGMARAAAAAPPRVVSASPDNGDSDVDPALKEIRIVFDQDMSRGGHSVCGGGPAFPKIAGKPRWANARTFVLPVKLEPEHAYQLSINCPAAQNFRGTSGEPAEAYPISFTTRAAGASSAARLTVEINRKAVAALRRAIDESYSYRDLHHVDWNKRLKAATAKLEKAETPAAFAREAARFLRAAKDLHITVKVGGQVLGTHRRSVSPNCNLTSLAAAVPNWRKHNDCVYSGRFDDGIGYVMVTTWAPSDRKMLDAVYSALDEMADAKGLILDVRPNSGGDELLARTLAGCFVPKAAVYSRNVYRDKSTKNGFTQPIDRVIEPRTDRPRYAGKVAVLMGIANMSSCESFLLMMRQDPACKLFGTCSYGSSGNPKPHDLGNGVTVLLPSWKDMLPDGTLLEGKGIDPDVAVKAEPSDFARGDPVLDAALKWLRE